MPAPPGRPVAKYRAQRGTRRLHQPVDGKADHSGLVLERVAVHVLKHGFCKERIKLFLDGFAGGERVGFRLLEHAQEDALFPVDGERVHARRAAHFHMGHILEPDAVWADHQVFEVLHAAVFAQGPHVVLAPPIGEMAQGDVQVACLKHANHGADRQVQAPQRILVKGNVDFLDRATGHLNLRDSRHPHQPRTDLCPRQVR